MGRCGLLKISSWTRPYDGLHRPTSTPLDLRSRLTARPLPNDDDDDLLSLPAMNATFLDAPQLRYLSTHTPLYYSPKASLVSWLPDNLLALAAPIVAYWVLSIFFHIFDMSEWKWLDRFRIHESEEVKARNLVTRTEVVVAVIFQHIVQTAIGLLWVEDKPAGAQVDHLANMVQMAPYLEWVATWILGQEAAAQLLVSRGAEGLYTIYWWAIPATKFFLGMCVIHVPSPRDFPSPF